MPCPAFCCVLLHLKNCLKHVISLFHILVLALMLLSLLMLTLLTSSNWMLVRMLRMFSGWVLLLLHLSKTIGILNFLASVDHEQKTEKCFLAEVIWSKKSSFVWNDPKESKWVQNGPKWSKICYIDHFGSFWTLVDHFGTSATLPFLVIFGPKRAFLDPPAHMIEGRQGPKLLQTNFVYV